MLIHLDIQIVFELIMLRLGYTRPHPHHTLPLFVRREFRFVGIVLNQLRIVVSPLLIVVLFEQEQPLFELSAFHPESLQLVVLQLLGLLLVDPTFVWWHLTVL